MTTKHRDDWPMRFARDSTDRRRRASCLHFRLDRGLDIHRSRRSPHDRRYRKFVTKGIGETKAERSSDETSGDTDPYLFEGGTRTGVGTVDPIEGGGRRPGLRSQRNDGRHKCFLSRRARVDTRGGVHASGPGHFHVPGAQVRPWSRGMIHPHQILRRLPTEEDRRDFGVPAKRADTV